MNESEELKQELEQEVQLVQYRQKMLDIIEEKLIQMKQIAEQAKESNLSPIELDVLNGRINNLAKQVKALERKAEKLNMENIRTSIGSCSSCWC